MSPQPSMKAGATGSSEPQLRLLFEPERQIYSVSDLSLAIKTTLERSFSGIWVTGEISGCKSSANGHTYFSLKDSGAQIKCVLFKGTARWLKFRPEDGLSVIAKGSLDIYQQRGDFQLIVDQLEIQGAGALQLAFEQLKRKLNSEGLFAQELKKPLPKFPRRVALITSQQGAVIHDMLRVFERRFPGLHIQLYPVPVQGDGAVAEVGRDGEARPVGQRGRAQQVGLADALEGRRELLGAGDEGRQEVGRHEPESPGRARRSPNDFRDQGSGGGWPWRQRWWVGQRQVPLAWTVRPPSS